MRRNSRIQKASNVQSTIDIYVHTRHIIPVYLTGERSSNVNIPAMTTQYLTLDILSFYFNCHRVNLSSCKALLINHKRRKMGGLRRLG